ncbi:hypothetical protein WN55_08005 [Dufourea novaeangliae]|uniref:Uncharacterized protein n=1 Tax=Dufourea novaeangliae TaxID=178035 RepID=A0A154P6X1_DUFNO|nr:hypothetical protein WN55_08005 [Dufourea novaeangliae]
MTRFVEIIKQTKTRSVHFLTDFEMEEVHNSMDIFFVFMYAILQRLDQSR